MVRSQPVYAPVQTLLLEPNEWVPNNPHLPILIYIKAIAAKGSDPVADFKNTFSTHGWPPQWCAGVYDYHHYHTQGHEVLGVVSGFARLMLGGPNGRLVEVSAGDVLLLPVGTGHCNTQCSDDFLVVGAYPPGQHADTCRQAPSQQQLASILSLSFPEQDPVQGVHGAVHRYWGCT
ncbi:cupin [Pseudomonas alkylphenolica]|uniref:Cupin n=1 Tax=Pseudomonas alkylphenolica TaxID=237609 RepID=A0A443ZET1_9PSED|nr:cupin [Pseudomonas alkylphenolica]RWU17205.1 cupin [Pseudomonas alkylphenolica]